MGTGTPLRIGSSRDQSAYVHRSLSPAIRKPVEVVEGAGPNTNRSTRAAGVEFPAAEAKAAVAHLDGERY
jgi:hypothetical protein